MKGTLTIIELLLIIIISAYSEVPKSSGVFSRMAKHKLINPPNLIKPNTEMCAKKADL
jgi:hypothetical protein